MYSFLNSRRDYRFMISTRKRVCLNLSTVCRFYYFQAIDLLFIFEDGRMVTKLAIFEDVMNV